MTSWESNHLKMHIPIKHGDFPNVRLVFRGGISRYVMINFLMLKFINMLTDSTDVLIFSGQVCKVVRFSSRFIVFFMTLHLISGNNTPYVYIPVAYT